MVTVGALIVSYTIMGVPYCSYSKIPPPPQIGFVQLELTEPTLFEYMAKNQKLGYSPKPTWA